MTRKEPTNLADGDLLKVEGVKVLFDGFKALDVDAFSLGFYELRVVIGPNGAGKTTLCDVISGKTRSTAGSITFAGRQVTLDGRGRNRPARRRPKIPNADGVRQSFGLSKHGAGSARPARLAQ